VDKYFDLKTTEITSNDNSQYENLRMLIPAYFERINHLSSIISNIDGFLVAIFIGIVIGVITFYDNPNGYNIVIFLSFIGFISLITWRYLSHKIDGQIVEFYGLVIKGEKKLGIKEDFSLLNRLINKFYPQIKAETSENQFNFILDRINNKKFHDRDHLFWDFVAYFLFVLLMIFLINYIMKNSLSVNSIIISISFLFFIGVIFYGYFRSELV
jgi:hypothetical protein